MNEMEESLSVKISANITPSQSAFIDKAADIEEMSRAEYVRYLIDREMKFTERPFIRWLLGRIDPRWQKQK